MEVGGKVGMWSIELKNWFHQIGFEERKEELEVAFGREDEEWWVKSGKWVRGSFEEESFRNKKYVNVLDDWMMY